MNDHTRLASWTALVMLLSSALFANGAAAQARGEWKSPQHLFESSCIYCHTTGVSPTLFGRDLPRDYVFSRVRQGYRAMPAFKPSEFNDEELETLRLWLNDQPLEN